MTLLDCTVSQEFEERIRNLRQHPSWIIGCNELQSLAQESRIEDIFHQLGSCIWNIEHQYTAGVAARFANWEVNLSLHIRRLWAYFYIAFRFCKREYRDRLVIEVKLVHALGELPSQTLWTDMPFFLDDMVYFYNQDCAVMSRSQRQNLHYILATAAGIGVISPKLCGIGMVVLRETFETDREMGVYDLADSEDSERTMDNLVISDLLESAELWLFKARDQIKILASRSYCDYSQSFGRLGPLAKQAGVPENDGFSNERLEFWWKRYFHIIKSRHPERGDDWIGPQQRWPESFDL